MITTKLFIKNFPITHYNRTCNVYKGFFIHAMFEKKS